MNNAHAFAFVCLLEQAGDQTVTVSLITTTLAFDLFTCSDPVVTQTCGQTIQIKIQMFINQVIKVIVHCFILKLTLGDGMRTTKHAVHLKERGTRDKQMKWTLKVDSRVIP